MAGVGLDPRRARRRSYKRLRDFLHTQDGALQAQRADRSAVQGVHAGVQVGHRYFHQSRHVGRIGKEELWYGAPHGTKSLLEEDDKPGDARLPTDV